MALSTSRFVMLKLACFGIRIIGQNVRAKYLPQIDPTGERTDATNPYRLYGVA
jgi:hypothetical protein